MCILYTYMYWKGFLWFMENEKGNGDERLKQWLGLWKEAFFFFSEAEREKSFSFLEQKERMKYK